MDKKKILIVDDDVNFTTLVKLYLERTGSYEVAVDNEGNRFISLALDSKPDMFILDIMMPNIDGGEVAQQIKSNDQLRDIPIMFLTAILKKSETAGQDGYIGKYPFMAKPVKVIELVNRIEKIIGKKQA